MFSPWLKRVLKEDTVLELDVVFDTTHNIITDNPGLTQLSGDVSIASFCPEGFVGIGVQIGTDTFARNFVAKTCRSIIDDVQKLDDIQDGFTHYQILRFYQDTRLQYFNSHILLGLDTHGPSLVAC